MCGLYHVLLLNDELDFSHISHGLWVGPMLAMGGVSYWWGTVQGHRGQIAPMRDFALFSR